MKHKDIRALQLGMNPSTASGRLVKDILFKFIVDTDNNKCFHCGKEMTRDNFSIEHKIPWLHSDNPVSLYFNLENISFSHLSCNSSAARSPNKLSPEEKKISLELSKIKRRQWSRDNYTYEKRRERYLRSKNG